MKIEVATLADLNHVSKAILENYPHSRVFAFFGSMGAGKTTLIKHLCAFLKVKDVVTSPSFSIVNQYETSNGDLVYHFDFYRIKKLTEVYDLGYEDYLYSNSYCFLEWPDLIEDLLPESYVRVDIFENEAGVREINIAQIN